MGVMAERRAREQAARERRERRRREHDEWTARINAERVERDLRHRDVIRPAALTVGQVASLLALLPADAACYFAGDEYDCPVARVTLDEYGWVRFEEPPFA